MGKKTKIPANSLPAQLVGRLGIDGFWDGDYAALWAHAGGVQYGSELGSSKRVGLLCFQIKHSTHTNLNTMWLYSTCFTTVTCLSLQQEIAATTPQSCLFSTSIRFGSHPLSWVLIDLSLEPSTSCTVGII